MQIPPNYEINVALNGTHYCRIELGNNCHEKYHITKAKQIAKRFPKKEGFEVTLFRIVCHSEKVKF